MNAPIDPQIIAALTTVGVSAVFALFAYIMVLRAARPGAGGSTGDGGTGGGGVPEPKPKPKPRFTDIVATSFAGQGDVESSAYTGRVIDGDQLGAALPYHFSGTIPTLSIFYGGKSVSGVPIVDIGPWNTNDPYWNNGGRPQAESGTDNTGRRTNLAGIDLTPGTWEKLGVSPSKSSAVKDKVTWDFDTYLAGTTPSPAPPVAGAPWITLGRTYNGLIWNGGPMPMQIVAWLDTIAAKFPDEAIYCQTLKTAGKTDWFAWCGLYVRSMLAPYGIKGPISDAGLRGETTTSDWAYVDAWLSWGTKVWSKEDGSISNAQPQVGDVLIWKAPGIHHVSFYGKPLPDTDTFSSLGGDQGKPLRVCEEELPMSWCVAIRRAA